MKNTTAIIVIITILFLSFLAIPNAQGQNRKKLKAAIEKLKSEKALLTKQMLDEQQQNKSLNNEIQNLEQKILNLEQDLNGAKIDYKTLNEEFNEYKLAEEKRKAAVLETKENQKKAQSYLKDCSLNNLNLQANNSYTLKFNKINVHGWGLQVYSFNSLCLAKERADKFSKQYRLYKTYIRVKEINGQKVYAVLYGSLKYKEQAEVYCKNFRNVARDKGGQNAFLVQH